MKRHLIGSLIAGALLFALASQGNASPDGKTRSFVYTINKSPDYVFVTAYGVEQNLQAKYSAVIIGGINDITSTFALSGPLSTDNNLGQWCVAPGATDHHGLTAVIHSVHIEVRAYGCTYSDVASKYLSFAGIDPSGQPTASAKPGVATITGGGVNLIGDTHNMPGGGPGNTGGPGGPSEIAEKVPIVITEARGAAQ